MKHAASISWIRLTLLLVVSVVCMSSCSSPNLKAYPGPDLPKSEIAILNVPKGLTIHSVNDKRIDTVSPPYSLEVMPGLHTLSASLDGVFGRASREFRFEAGRSYSFVCRTDYIVSLNRHAPKYCGIVDDASPETMSMLWKRGGP